MLNSSQYDDQQKTGSILHHHSQL